MTSSVTPSVTCNSTGNILTDLSYHLGWIATTKTMYGKYWCCHRKIYSQFLTIYFQDYSDSFGGIDNEYLFTAWNSYMNMQRRTFPIGQWWFSLYFFPEPIDFVYWKYNFYQFSIKLLLELSFQCLTMSRINAVDSTQIVMMMMLMMMTINFTNPVHTRMKILIKRWSTPPCPE